MSQEHQDADAEGPKPDPKNRAPVKVGPRNSAFDRGGDRGRLCWNIRPSARRREAQTMDRRPSNSNRRACLAAGGRRRAGSRSARQCRGLCQRLHSRANERLCPRMAQGHRRQVHQGEVLAVVDTPELDQSIAVAQSELARSKANLALAKVDGGAVEFAARHRRRISAGCGREGRQLQRPGGRGRSRPVERRPAESAEGVRQYRGPIRRRGHRPQRRHRFVGQSGLERYRGAVHRRRHSSRCGFMFPCRNPMRLP